MPKKQKILLRAYIAFVALFAVAPVSNDLSRCLPSHLYPMQCTSWRATCLQATAWLGESSACRF